VIVDDLDSIRIAVPPFETDSPLVVDPNAVLSGTPSREPFQPITRRHTKILERLGGIEHHELSQDDPLQTLRKSTSPLPLEDLSRFGAPEALDHGRSITPRVNNVKRYYRPGRAFGLRTPG
jgi:hypothetical protein